MDRRRLVRNLESKLRTLNYRLSKRGNYKSNGQILKDFSRFVTLEKEIQIQKCYIGQNE